MPLSDFVLEQADDLLKVCDNCNQSDELDLARREFIVRVTNYTKLLKQPLKQEMFVPCLEDGNIIEPEPLEFDGTNQLHFYKYDEAEKKVLFHGFHLSAANEVKNNSLKLTLFLSMYQFVQVRQNCLGGGDLFGETTEALAYADLGIELTPSALQQIGINNRV
ncbi:hypothetical protein SAMN05421856_101429 [Chryseobacterium taichungense]|uniref:Uncharacterized protein n=2 Tax=Chryseobacterium taichungense TaxID=295069 RepID=A0A1H7W1D0_9FLAO|nr:hypothetical protein SAMN05421856_101429 [Chryseobacterium taichungense]